MVQWPCNDGRKTVTTVLVERVALGGVTCIRVAREDAGALRHRAIIPCHVLCHVARQKTNTTAIDAVIDPDGSNHRLLLPLHQNLHHPETHNNILHHHLPTVEVLITGAPLVAALHPNNLRNDTRWMVRLLGDRNVRGRRLLFDLLGCLCPQLAGPHHGSCTWNRQRRALIMDDGAAHRTRHSSPLILGKGAGAAPPEAAGGGGHGESCLCCVSALGIFSHSLTHLDQNLGIEETTRNAAD